MPSVMCFLHQGEGVRVLITTDMYAGVGARAGLGIDVEGHYGGSRETGENRVDRLNGLLFSTLTQSKSAAWDFDTYVEYGENDSLLLHRAGG